MNSGRFSIWIGLLAASMLVSGCSGPKALSAMDRNTVGAIKFDSKVNIPVAPAVLTIAGKRATEAGAGGGLIGMIVGASTAKISASDEKEVLSLVRQQTGPFEVDAFRKNIEQQMQTAGFAKSTNLAQGTLFALEISTFGLSEIRKGRYAPLLSARASLKELHGKKIWSAHAVSVGENGHTMDEYRQRPALYQETFQEVSADVAHQLISGPIRPLQ